MNVRKCITVKYKLTIFYISFCRGDVLSFDDFLDPDELSCLKILGQCAVYCDPFRLFQCKYGIVELPCRCCPETCASVSPYFILFYVIIIVIIIPVFLFCIYLIHLFPLNKFLTLEQATPPHT